MIKIVFKNGCIAKWKKKEWTDYKYDGKCFIVIKNGSWVGIYNVDSIVSVVIKEKMGEDNHDKRSKSNKRHCC